ncbi:uncharacterized protein LOC144440253 [Glandiceps talaboti]
MNARIYYTVCVCVLMIAGAYATFQSYAIRVTPKQEMTPGDPETRLFCEYVPVSGVDTNINMSLTLEIAWKNSNGVILAWKTLDIDDGSTSVSSSSNRYEIIEKATLVIYNVTPSDVGTYTCSITTSTTAEGGNSGEVHLDVELVQEAQTTDAPDTTTEYFVGGAVTVYVSRYMLVMSVATLLLVSM